MNEHFRFLWLLSAVFWIGLYAFSGDGELLTGIYGSLIMSMLWESNG